MKNLKTKIRKYISARLIELLWDMFPSGEFKSEYAKFITTNIFKL